MNLPSRCLLNALAVLALAILSPGPARAGIDLSIARCAPQGDSTIRLDCAHADSVIEIIGTFQVPDTVRNFIGIGVTVDFETETDDLPPFWRFEATGCNRTGITLTDAIPDDVCDHAVNVWGEKGSEAFSGIAAYGPEYEGYHRGRLVAAVVRSASNPVDLVPGVNYFGFTLRLFLDNAAEAGGKCAGCKTPVRVIWSSAMVEMVSSVPGEKPPPGILLTGPGLGTHCVRLNGARGACESLPPRPPARKPENDGH
jgi:hypothetical protein